MARWTSMLAPSIALWLYYVSLFERPANVSSRKFTHALVERVTGLLRAQQYDQAQRPLEKLVQAYPKNHVYLGQLADVYLQLRMPKEEAAIWERYVVISPNPYEACPRFGLAYREQGRMRESVNAFERCLSFAPGDSDMLLFLGLAYERTHDDERADQLYAEALKVAPNYPDVALGRGRVALRRGDPRTALKLAAGVLARSPDNADALFVAGLAALRLKDLPAAHGYLEHGLKERDDSDVRLALGLLAEAEHKADDALVQYAASLRLNPANSDARLRQERLQGRAR